MTGQLGGIDLPVAPVFLLTLGSGAHGLLLGYKAAPTASGRSLRSGVLASLLADHLDRHLGCLTRRGTGSGQPLASGSASRPGAASLPVALVPVPSSLGGRPSWQGTHPLVEVCRIVAARLGDDRLEVLDELRPSPWPPRRLAASRGGFVVASPSRLRQRGVIVVDDIFTSGARLLSACAALVDAGANVCTAMPIGRTLRPGHNQASSAFFADLVTQPWSPERCVRCPSGASRADAGLAAASPAVGCRMRGAVRVRLVLAA